MTETNAYYHHPGLDAARIADDARIAPDPAGSIETVDDSGDVSDLSAVACPACGERSLVINSRERYIWTGDEVVRRRRSCADCQMRWTTYELHADTVQRLRKGGAE